MGHFSVKIIAPDGSNLNGNQHHKDVQLKLLPLGNMENGLVPIYWEDDTVLAANIHLSMPIDPNKITSLNNLILISVGFLINIVIGYILARFLAWRIARPIINLSEAALAFSKGNINVVDKKGMAYEIKTLANTLEATFIERARIQGELQHLVNFDHLTGALTRRHFHNSFDAVLQLAKRSGDGIALLYLDLDRFKSINDTYGHDAGDQVLRSVVERMRLRLRGSDLVGRRGGDEFNVGLYPVRHRAEVETVCNDLISLLSQPIPIKDDVVVSVGVSIGIALFPDHGDLTGLLEINADTALYRAKSSGGNHFEWFSGSPSSEDAALPLQPIALHKEE